MLGINKLKSDSLVCEIWYSSSLDSVKTCSSNVTTYKVYILKINKNISIDWKGGQAFG